MNIIKWFRNRQRINRRLRLAAAGWTLLLCVVCVGCEPDQKPAFREGQFIILRIGGQRCQVVDHWSVSSGHHYNVRIESGKVLVDLNEFELTIIKE